MKTRFNWYSTAWLAVMLIIAAYDFYKCGVANFNPWIDVAILVIIGPLIFRRRHTRTVVDVDLDITVESRNEAAATRVADILRKGVEPVETPVQE